MCALQELRNPAPVAQQIAARQEGQRLSDSVVISSPVNTLQGNILLSVPTFISIESSRALILEISVLLHSPTFGLFPSYVTFLR